MWLVRGGDLSRSGARRPMPSRWPSGCNSSEYAAREPRAHNRPPHRELLMNVAAFAGELERGEHSRPGRCMSPPGASRLRQRHFRSPAEAIASKRMRFRTAAYCPTILVAPTGFGSQASLFEIAFQGLAFAAWSRVPYRDRGCHMWTRAERGPNRSSHGLPIADTTPEAAVGLCYHPAASVTGG